MTTTNSGRIVDHAEGVVQSSNERGVKLVGEDGYRNFSKYAEPPIAAPARGSSVRLGLDASGFVRVVENLNGAPATTSGSSSSSRDRTITRLAVLKAASNFVGLWGATREEVKSDHVLMLADKWLAWVEQADEEREEDSAQF
jgi:hypothetical protein